MMQKLGLSDPKCIIERLESELKNLALNHMKKRGPNRAKWVRIPVAFAAQLIWKVKNFKHVYS